jgi:diaminopimelate decarboxylase
LTLKDNLVINDKNSLTLHGVDIVSLGNEYGTPLFVYDEPSLVEGFDRIRLAFESVYSNVMVCYSVKTINNLAICRLLQRKGAFAEVSSELDLHVALKAGFPGERMVYDGPFKPKVALRKALESDVLLINTESYKEMNDLNDVASEMGRNQAIGIRLNPFKEPSLLKSLKPRNLLEDAGYCYPSCRFGFPLEAIPMILDHLKKMNNLSLECLMIHPYTRAQSILPLLLKEFREKHNIGVKYLNIGGGFEPQATGYTGDLSLALDFVRRKLGLKSKLERVKSVPNIEDIAKSIVGRVKQNLDNQPEPALIMEPGRFIVGPSGMLLLRVDQIRMAGGYKWVSVDGGTNLLPAIHDRRTVLIANRANASGSELVNVVGPLLYPKDFVAIKKLLPHIEENDLLAVQDCGAYSLSSSTQFLYPRPAAVLVNSKGEVRVIRDRETYDDVCVKDRLS